MLFTELRKFLKYYICNINDICVLCDEYVSITADEMTDVCDHSILNVIASI